MGDAFATYLTIAASAVLLAVAGAVYGLPPIESPVRAIAGIAVGAIAFTSLGLTSILGTAVGGMAGGCAATGGAGSP